MADMIRRAFTMRLKSGKFEEYKYHHEHVWPELVAEIERSGIATMTIFRDPAGDGTRMFVVSEITDGAAWDRLWSSAIHDKWAAVMEPLLNLTADNKVDAAELQEVYRLETKAEDVHRGDAETQR
jgi:L-rhamnose mutarotase